MSDGSIESAGVGRVQGETSCIVLLALAIVVSNPLAFQKLNTIVPADGFDALHTPEASVDIASIIARTPISRVERLAFIPRRSTGGPL